MTKNITILGSTGTIGCNAIELISFNSFPLEGEARWGGDNQHFTVEALTAGRNVELLAKQAIAVSAKLAVIEDESKYQQLKELLQGTNIEVAAGKQALIDAASRPCDMLISAIVGAAALPPTLAAIRQGTIIGLANKECLVCAGDLMMDEVKRHGAELIPIDSEHNSLFQVFDFDNIKQIEKITLTASGGPFWNMDIADFANITPQMAVKHPNWTMGAKISVDSATMFNKGLEIIEAYYLFPIEKNQIDVVVHPQSIIHAMAHYKDGTVLAGMSEPDMKMPISYALGWPNRLENNVKRLDFAKIGRLDFITPDEKKFPALNLAKQALEQGNTATCIFNAANEIAVDAFLNKKISFLNIINVVQDVLQKMRVENFATIDDVFYTDNKARELALQAVSRLN